jgi:sugar lactone lactonase YvrE
VAGTGVAGFSGDNGLALAAQLNLPYGLAVDLAGNLYIADLNNNRVRRVDTGGMITTFAGSGGDGSSGDGGLATAAQLLTPRNLAVDASGTVYISEFGAHRVRAVTLDGRISTVAGIGIAGFRGDGGPAVNAQLNCPAGLAVDRTGALYIADSQNMRVRKILPGGQISTVLGGTPSIMLQTPIAVAVDLSGNLFVADDSTVIREYSASGAWSNFAGTGDPGFYGDGGLASAAELIQPLDLGVNLAGSLFIADGVRVREVAGGVIQTIAGDDYTHAIGDGGSATAAELLEPAALSLDSAGNTLIADTGTQRVRKVSPGGVISTVAGTGVAAAGADVASGATTTLNYPMGVAADRSGNVLIAETHAHRIRQVSPDGTIRTVMGTGSPGTGPEGLPPTQTMLRGPRGLCMDHNGALYVADTANHRILQWTPGGTVLTVAGNGSPGSAGDGGQARLAQLQQPYACSVDSFGDLYIADTFNHRIRKVDSTGIITTVAGTGVAGYSGDETAATAANLNMPQGVTADDNGDIFISDTNNSRIRQVTPDGVIHTIAGTGAAAYGGDGGAALNAQIDSPGGIVLDGAGDLFFEIGRAHV